MTTDEQIRKDIQELKQTLDYLVFAVLGDERTRRKGLLERMDDMEMWREAKDDEVIEIKALARGIKIGFGALTLTSLVTAIVVVLKLIIGI